MPRKTDTNSPADWLSIVEDDLVLLRVGARDELSYALCRSKLAEVLEKVMKAELIRLGWTLEKTHDLQVLHDRLAERGSDLLDELRDPISALAEAVPLQDSAFWERGAFPSGKLLLAGDTPA